MIGAHYDHLGRVGGDVYQGADDNASGTAVVLGLARAFAAAGGAPRTLIFVLFSGEEMGLIGSGHYVRHPVLPLERTIVMVNFDMVGRMRDGRVTASGVESGEGCAPSSRAGRERAADAVASRLPPRALGSGALLLGRRARPLLHHRAASGLSPADRHRRPARHGRHGADRRRRHAALDGLAAAPRPVYARVAPSGRRAPEATGAQPAGGAFLGVSVDGASPSDGLRLGNVVPDSGAERARAAPRRRHRPHRRQQHRQLRAIFAARSPASSPATPCASSISGTARITPPRSPSASAPR